MSIDKHNIAQTPMSSKGEVEKETISIRPFSSNANCLKPTLTCQGTSPNFIGKFFD